MTFLFVFFLCLILSGFLSGSEMAFVSANKLKLRELADGGDLRAKKIMRLQEHPHQFLTIVLIMNNITMITATSAAAFWLQQNFKIESEWLVTLLTVPFFIILGETVPKDYGRLRSQQFLLAWASVLEFFLKILQRPAVWLLKGVDLILGPFGGPLHRSIFVSEEEFRLLIEESTSSGILNPHEKKLVDTILDFERIHVESVMTSSDRVAKIEISESIARAKEIALKTQARMILVYEEIPSIIVGMIYVFDLLFEKDEKQTLKKYLRSPIFLSKNTSIEKAFLTLQQKRQSFAVVTDMHGEVIGVVPIERLFTL